MEKLKIEYINLIEAIEKRIERLKEILKTQRVDDVNLLEARIECLSQERLDLLDSLKQIANYCREDNI